jgi:hypothetical protein
LPVGEAAPPLSSQVSRAPPAAAEAAEVAAAAAAVAEAEVEEERPPSDESRDDFFWKDDFFLKELSQRKNQFYCLNKENDATRRLDSQEGLWVQWLTLKKYPNARRIFSSWHAGPGQISFGPQRRQKVDGFLCTAPGKFLVCQYHSDKYHYQGHWHGCEQKDEAVPFELFHPSLQMEYVTRNYISCLNEQSDVTGITFSYELFYSCNMGFHDGQQGGLSRLGNMLKEEFPFDSVGWEKIPNSFKDEKALLSFLLQDDRATGFVTLEGGEETAADLVSLCQGFCMGKYSPKSEELGSFARDLGGGEKKFSAALKSKLLTVAKLSFDKSHPVTLSVGLLRWLMKFRKLRNFKILHYIYFPFREYLAPFILSILSERQQLKKNEPDSIKIQLLKLVLNSTYGHWFLEASNFTKSHICTEKNALKRKLLESPHLLSSTILGVTKPKVKKKKQEIDVVMEITTKDPFAKINNAIQCAVQILSASKFTFFSIIFSLLTMLHPKKATIVYYDTDGMFIFAKHKKLEENILEKYQKCFQACKHFLFENVTSQEAQNGKLKEEGIFRGVVIRTSKCYRLINELKNPEEEDFFRFKGIPSSAKNYISRAQFLPAGRGGEAEAQARPEEKRIEEQQLSSEERMEKQNEVSRSPSFPSSPHHHHHF